VRPIFGSKFTVDRFPGDKKCRWRGSGKHCYPSGDVGEVVLFKSRWGGFPAEDGESTDENKCKSGFKYFTCPYPGFDDIMDDCRWEEDW
jgi:hypothetical protein